MISMIMKLIMRRMVAMRNKLRKHFSLNMAVDCMREDDDDDDDEWLLTF